MKDMWGKCRNTFGWFRNQFGKNREANIFLVIALCAGIAMALINPPLHECDAGRHHRWAMDVSYGNLLSPIINLTGHGMDVVTVPKNFYVEKYHMTEPGTGEGGEYIRYLQTVKYSLESTEVEEDWVFTSLFYYPQAFGLFLGRTLQMSVYGVCVLSRICNLLVFLALTYGAIAITPVYKNILAVIALFPITLYQAASVSPDSMLNGLCFLFVSVCFCYAYGEREHLDWRAAIKLGVILAAVCMCKYVYACLGMLVFLIPMKRFGSKKEYWRCFVIACLPLAFAMVFGMMNARHTITVGQSFGGVDGMTQLQYLMKNPFFVIEVLLRTIRYKFNDYMLWLNTLGALNYELGPLVYMVPMFAVFVGCLDQNEASAGIKVRDKFLCFGTFLLISIGVVLGIYIGDGKANPLGAEIVQGVQGRYFIPVIPVFFAAISSSKVKNRIRNFTAKAMSGMGIFLLYAVFRLYRYCF